MNARHVRWLNILLVSSATILVMTVPLILFCVSQMKYVVERLGDGVPDTIIVVYVLMIVQFIASSASNPGILKKQYFPDNVYNCFTGAPRKVAPPRFLEFNVNGQVIRTKYCVTCHIYRPPRTVHCSSCGGCILRYDHHCPYISNCIGSNNYRRFTSFVVTCSIYLLLLTVFGVYRFVGFFPHIGSSLDGNPAEIICAILSIAFNLLGLWLMSGLCFFHVLLITKGESTYDRIKGNFVEFNPFYRGWRRSIRDFLCGGAHYLSFVNPWSSQTQPSSVYNPGAMFKSQQHREEVLRKNNMLDDGDDMDVMHSHDRNTLKYVKTFGQHELLTPTNIEVKRAISTFHNSDTDTLPTDSHN